MVPFGPFAFMPGKLVHTNEVTVLLGENWFAKCSAKQAVGLVEHGKEHVRKTIHDFLKVMKNFESRVEFTEDLQKMSDAAGDIVDIREEIEEGIHRAGLHLRPVCADHAWPPLQGTLSSVLSACGNDKGRIRPPSGQGNLEEEKTDTNHPCLRTVSIGM